MSGGLGKSICVVGAGAVGLVATKNLVEEGFDVTTYERNDYIGGLWRFTRDETKPSVLERTRANFSKYGACFSDFPYPDDHADADVHPTAVQTLNYLNAFADHFGVTQHVRFSTQVQKIERDDKTQKWNITVQPVQPTGRPETHAFDRLVIATGPHGRPNFPKLKGSELFKGDLIHSHQFKDPSQYEGKTVIVLGTASTAVDTIEFLRGAGASKIYMSHRRSLRVLPRMKEGKAIDMNITRRRALISAYVTAVSPSLAKTLMSTFLGKMQKETWPELANNPAFSEDRVLGSINSTLPVVSDDLPRNLLDGSAESVQAIDYITGPHSVMLKDGTEIDDIDAIICCTGSMLDFGAILPTEYDPTNPELAPDGYSALKSAKYYKHGMKVSRAYRKFLSLQSPHSLAFLGNTIYRRSAFALYDLISMSLAQLWKGTSPMPSKEEMKKECDAHYHFLVSELQGGEVGLTGLINGLDYDRWLQGTARCGVWERLGWGWKGWSLYLRDRKLYSMLMDGVDSPHALRLFDTGEGRKPWPGARAAIEKANKEVEKGVEKWKKEQGEKVS